jgi:glyoxylase-like metal-dependent hydrolase (beta-lactamase superfamily II)
MAEIPAPNQIDPDEWRNACQCARIHILANAGRRGGSYDSEFARRMFELSCEDVAGTPLFTSALEAVQADLDRRLKEKEEQEERERDWSALRRSRLPPDHERAWAREKAQKIIGHQRHQLPVGQGGFHVGTLSRLGNDEADWRAAITDDAISDADFLYVYDCGSDPLDGALEEVKRVVANRTTRQLDMLFVSHFDRDHISGIPHLLDRKKGLQVDTIVMPYLEPVDRLIAFARTVDVETSAETAEFHAGLVVDPIEAMQGFEPRVIILVAPSEEDGEFTRIARPPAEPPVSAPGRAPWKVETDGYPWGRHPPIQTQDGATILVRGDFRIMDDGTGGWSLKPYVRRADRADREAFATAVEVLLRWPRGSFATKVEDKAERLLLVTKHREKIGRAAKWAFKDKNQTSLSLYSGPLDPRHGGAVYGGLPRPDQARIGWLGTGDAGLRCAGDIDRFRQHFRDELPIVSTLVLPHHGSIHNFDPARPAVIAELMVAAADPTRDSWIHPDPAIVAAVEALGAQFRKVGRRPEKPVDERMIAETIDVIAVLARDASGRRLAQLAAVQGLDPRGEYQLTPLIPTDGELL